MELIDSIAQLDNHTFSTVYFNRKPVILKQAVLQSKAYNTWTPDYLKAFVGAKVVKVSHSKKGLYTIAEDGDLENIFMPFEKAIDLFKAGDHNNETYYLQETSMFEYFPELLEDLGIPPLNSNSDQIERINFWMGARGCLTQLHFDGPHNFLVQIMGRKEIIFFAPEDAVYLYPKTGGIKAHESQVDLDNIDEKRFPLAKNAKPYFGVLEPGDLLYLPSNWWHQVRTVEMSISVNYWWNRFDITEGMQFEKFEVSRIFAIIQSFVDRGMSVAHCDEVGELLFIKAISNGYPNVVEAFLLMGIDPDATSRKYHPGMPALFVARKKGNEEIINLLFRYGAKEYATVS